MSAHLLVRLNAAFEPFQWLTLDGDGQVLRGPQPASDAWPASSSVLVLCASPELSVRYVHAPAKGRERFRSAVAFALEDVLVDDVERLHFALPASLQAGMQPVAVMRKERMEALRARCAEFGLSPRALIPESALLPVDSVLVERGLVSFRLGSSSAGSIESDTLASLLKLRLVNEGALPLNFLLPDGVQIGPLPGHFSKQAIGHPLRFFAERLRAETVWPNLLSGAFAARAAQTSAWQRWRVALVLAGLAVLLEVIGFAQNYWQLTRTAHAQDAEIAKIYAELMPGKPLGLDPLGMINSRLQSEAAYASASSGAGLLPLLSRIAPVLYTETQLRLVNVEYRDGELELSFKSPDIATVDGLRARLATLQGLEVSLVSNNNIDPAGGLTGRIKLKAKS